MEYYLKTPLYKDDITDLKCGDVVYLSGTILTARDEAHARILEFNKKGKKLPFSLDGAIIYHCGPLVKQIGDEWEVVAAGPTTSARMISMTPSLLDLYDVHVLIGKGGMEGLSSSFKDRCIYLAYTGGCAALAVRNIKKVQAFHWPDLGMAEGVWELEVEYFGPLIVGMDAKGNDLFSAIKEKAKRLL
ncbi:FumA C-terminus/TtdB family hydratase beta subunit [Methanohalophilus sp.]|uniref:FumA C-terminus/TtdB family hydratase beta subunit n=1 Tax=Methanohalophilus sp. TaxID=1966352 RepID=UPI0026365EFD|nr:FumA C-terminus/TtdB family hydratase beta subunit [Methanohalophilus sp.]MDK2892220.1 fumarate hydratase subunit beta [Methanohalophilus sp.]